jgi:Cu/Ag efflux protein CusF
MSEVPSQAPSSTLARGAHAYEEDGFADGFAAGNNAPEAVDLSADPFADDLSAELAAAAPRPWRNRATLVLAAAVLVVGGFVGGVQVEKHFGSTSASNARANAAAALAAARGGGGGFGRGGGAGGTGTGGTPSAAPSAATTETNTGKVTLVDGTTVYVTLSSGDVLTVKTTSSTRVSVGSVTKVSGLKAGDSVTVTGPTDSSGDVTATSITSGS